jgi:hypothetical protein
MLPHIDQWLPKGTICDSGELVEECRSGSLDPFPDPDTMITTGDRRADDALASLLHFRVRKFVKNHPQEHKRLCDCFPLDDAIKRHVTQWIVGHGLLRKPVAKMLTQRPRSEWEHIERVWLSVEDTLFLSSPEIFLEEYSRRYVRYLYRYTVSTMIVQGYEYFLKQWKTFCTYVRFKAFNSLGNCPKGPQRFPGFTPDGEWKNPGIPWLRRVLQRGLRSKGEATRLAHLCSSRGFPTPTREMIIASLGRHQQLLTSVPSWVPPKRLEFMYLLSRRIGRKIKAASFLKEMTNPLHVSLTNSSSFAYSRSDGGRAAEVQDEFASWANHIPKERRVKTHVLGSVFVEQIGIERWKSVITEPLNSDESGEEVRFGQPLPGGPFLSERRAGYNSNLGYQLLQCACEAGITRGVLDVNYNVIDYPMLRASVSSEPGGKARIVTSNEWWCTILLQPLGHLLVYLLQTLPQARAGLSASEPAWEWTEDLRRQTEKGVDEEFYHEMGLLTSDLSEATDHCNRHISRSMIEGFLDGVGLDYKSVYFKLAISLLVARRRLVTVSPA